MEESSEIQKKIKSFEQIKRKLKTYKKNYDAERLNWRPATKNKNNNKK